MSLGIVPIRVLVNYGWHHSFCIKVGCQATNRLYRQRYAYKKNKVRCIKVGCDVHTPVNAKQCVVCIPGGVDALYHYWYGEDYNMYYKIQYATLVESPCLSDKWVEVWRGNRHIWEYMDDIGYDEDKEPDVKTKKQRLS